MTSSHSHILIIEPRAELETPYSHITQFDTITRVESIELALKTLTHIHPALVMLSSSFHLSKSMPLLETLKHMSRNSLIPLVFVVDHTTTISSIPGTTWGSRCAILSSLSSKEECDSTLSRVLSL